MFSGFNVAKCETQVRLCHARIKLQKNKRTMAVKQMRKEVAELLRSEKQEYARIRVEGVIRENLLMQAYEILELYLELVAVRVQLIAKTKEIPRDMVEAISSIIYAAQRISDVPELASLRSLFGAKYGKEYVTEAGSDAGCTKWQVNANLIRCLLVEPPQPEDKLAMLSEIAQEHGVEWDLSSAARELLPTGMTAVAAHAPPPPHDGGHGGGPSYGGGGGGGAGRGVSQGMTAQQAAAAAEAAAVQARVMADRAAELAAIESEMQGLGPAPGGPPGPQPAQQQWGAPPPAGPGWPVQPAARTNSQIQRAYDAAMGPPSKPTTPYTALADSVNGNGYGAAQPSAPLGPHAHGGASSSTFMPSPPAHLPAPPSRDADPNVPQLPRPPKGLMGVGEAPEDEYDELSKRLDALKRS